MTSGSQADPEYRVPRGFSRPVAERSVTAESFLPLKSRPAHRAS